MSYKKYQALKRSSPRVVETFLRRQTRAARQQGSILAVRHVGVPLGTLGHFRTQLFYETGISEWKRPILCEQGFSISAAAKLPLLDSPDTGGFHLPFNTASAYAIFRKERSAKHTKIFVNRLAFFSIFRYTEFVRNFLITGRVQYENFSAGYRRNSHQICHCQ